MGADFYEVGNCILNLNKIVGFRVKNVAIPMLGNLKPKPDWWVTAIAESNEYWIYHGTKEECELFYKDLYKKLLELELEDDN